LRGLAHAHAYARTHTHTHTHTHARTHTHTHTHTHTNSAIPPICDLCFVSQVNQKGNTIEITCPDNACAASVEHGDVHRLTTASVFDYYDQQLLRRALRAMPDFQWCKNSRCGAGQVGDAYTVTTALGPTFKPSLLLAPTRAWAALGPASLNYDPHTEKLAHGQAWHLLILCLNYSRHRSVRSQGVIAVVRTDCWLRSTHRRCQPRCQRRCDNCCHSQLILLFLPLAHHR
jgi:hypothetical protein